MISSLLFGVALGGVVVDAIDEPVAARFRAALTADWLEAGGATLSVRAEIAHDLDLSGSALFGWSGRGLREGDGLPIGFGLGPVVLRNDRANVSAGGRAMIVLGLWFDRAAIEGDVSVLRPIAADGVEVVAGLSLRLVPWSPLVL
jgi:hypothetical protein